MGEGKKHDDQLEKFEHRSYTFSASGRPTFLTTQDVNRRDKQQHARLGNLAWSVDRVGRDSGYKCIRESKTAQG